MKSFTQNIWRDIKSSFSPRNLRWHLLAIAITALFVFTGLDWKYYQWVQVPLVHQISLVAGLAGFLVPVLVPLVMYLRGKWLGDRRLRDYAALVWRAVVSAWFISSAYKAITGRVQPDWFHAGAIDKSHEFLFGFWRNGIFWGWPSSHTMVAFAFGITIFVLYKKPNWIRSLALAYAIFIGFGAGSGFHWISDAIAGAILGTVVALSVIKNHNAEKDVGSGGQSA